jgi:hypothetical protein
MKKRLILSTLSLLTAGFMFIGCTGDDGAVGPAGAKGDTGAQGAGGAKGDAGTANVIYSEWLEVPETKTNSANNELKSVDFVAAKITQEIIDNGVILAYVKSGDNQPVTQLSYTTNFWNTNGTSILGSYSLYANAALGKITFYQRWITPGTIPSEWINFKGSIINRFRYVIIPKGLSGARQAAVDYSDYAAVKKHFNLPD